VAERPPTRPRPDAEWFARDAERNERAIVERLRADARKSVGQNLEEGAAFVKFAHEFAHAFRRPR